jgi:ribose/xylose/arabinose/galactoside ABC-type transport system permease subunit
MVSGMRLARKKFVIYAASGTMAAAGGVMATFISDSLRLGFAIGSTLAIEAWLLGREKRY